jgi:GxxExxY protein
MTYILDKETYSIRGAIFEVYKELGNGFLEAVYQEALEKELAIQNIPFLAQQEIKLFYKGAPLKQVYKPDLICYNQIILELKATSKILPEHEAQLINYLKATKLKLGLLVNFGNYPKVEIKRFVL